MPKVQHISLEDVRSGADRLHELLDGRIHLPDWLMVILVGVLGAILPVWILLMITGLELSI